MLIDTHAHIYLKEFEENISNIILTSQLQGIEYILMPNIDINTVSSMLSLESRYKTCHSMIGLHPCSVDNNYVYQLSVLYQYLVDNSGFVGIGEIGLDTYWDKTHYKEQIEAFEKQIMWALDFDLPIVIHSRDTLDETIDIVSKHQNGQLKGVFHCFNGSVEQGKRIVDIGFYMGIGGVVTFKNAGVDQSVAKLPLDNMVLETDAPYLAPVPFRGKRNEPAYLKYIALRLAEIMELSIEDIEEATTKNAKMLFNL